MEKFRVSLFYLYYILREFSYINFTRSNEKENRQNSLKVENKEQREIKAMSRRTNPLCSRLLSPFSRFVSWVFFFFVFRKRFLRLPFAFFVERNSSCSAQLALVPGILDRTDPPLRWFICSWLFFSLLIRRLQWHCHIFYRTRDCKDIVENARLLN